jgi:outer membrane protein TolC
LQEIIDGQVGTNLDVLDSRTALIESRTALVNAVYDIAAAQCGVMFVVGEDVLRGGDVRVNIDTSVK